MQQRGNVMERQIFLTNSKEVMPIFMTASLEAPKSLSLDTLVSEFGVQVEFLSGNTFGLSFYKDMRFYEGRFMVFVQNDQVVFQNLGNFKCCDGFDALVNDAVQNCGKHLITGAFEEMHKDSYNKLHQHNHVVPVGAREFDIIQPQYELSRHFSILIDNGGMKLKNGNSKCHTNLVDAFRETIKYARLSSVIA